MTTALALTPPGCTELFLHCSTHINPLWKGEGAAMLASRNELEGNRRAWQAGKGLGLAIWIIHMKPRKQLGEWRKGGKIMSQVKRNTNLSATIPSSSSVRPGSASSWESAGSWDQFHPNMQCAHENWEEVSTSDSCPGFSSCFGVPFQATLQSHSSGGLNKLTKLGPWDHGMA